IATAALRWMDDFDQIVLCSPDKDLLQCVVGDRDVVWDRMRDRRFDEDGVVEEVGDRPASMADYLALVRAGADGGPGLPVWGARSAADVLRRYGRIEMIPDDERDWGVDVRGAAKLAQVLRENRDTAMLYRTLTTLRRDVPLEESVEDLRWKGFDEPEYAALCERLGF